MRRTLIPLFLATALAVGIASATGGRDSTGGHAASAAAARWHGVVTLPELASVEWRCTSPQRFLARVRGAGVSITVRAVVGGRPIRFGPIARGVAQAPAEGPGEQRWSIESVAEPSSQKADLRLTYAVTPKNKRCYLARSETTVVETPHEP
jgi:hypothetical protein